ncbi:MAG: hypothetical protein FJ308_23805 [Planctomycetes bacterium]|nr:hypothetical protein [Planctomycetota bacterium]
MGGTSRSGGNRVLGIDSSEPDGLPSKPKMPAKVGKKWDQLLSELPKPALRRIDQHELKILCELLVHSDSLAEVMRKDPLDHATGRLYLNVADRIHRLSAAFGLSPADRKRLALSTESEDDPFQAWLADAMGQD